MSMIALGLRSFNYFKDDYARVTLPTSDYFA